MPGSNLCQVKTLGAYRFCGPRLRAWPGRGLSVHSPRRIRHGDRRGV